MRCLICKTERNFANMVNKNFSPICSKCLKKINHKIEVIKFKDYSVFDVTFKTHKYIRDNDDLEQVLFQYYNPIDLMMKLSEAEVEYNILFDYNERVLFQDEFTIIYNENVE